MGNDSRHISELKNLGPQSALWLQSTGINTVSDLKSSGPLNAYLAVKAKFPQASLNLLWALIAGLKNSDWRDLTPAEKKIWKDKLQQHLK